MNQNQLQTNKRTEPSIWSSLQAGLGAALQEMGQRRKDPALLTKAVAANRAALTIDQQIGSTGIKFHWDHLSIALQSLGELTKDPDTLREAEEAATIALGLKSKAQEALDWELTQNNLAYAQRWLGTVTRDATKLHQSRDGYAACEALRFESAAPFKWATLQWNIADLALARHDLTPDPALLVEARTYVTRARAFFVKGSEYQTGRCDDLLAQIEAAEAGS